VFAYLNKLAADFPRRRENFLRIGQDGRSRVRLFPSRGWVPTFARESLTVAATISEAEGARNQLPPFRCPPGVDVHSPAHCGAEVASDLPVVELIRALKSDRPSTDGIGNHLCRRGLILRCRRCHTGSLGCPPRRRLMQMDQFAAFARPPGAETVRARGASPMA